MYASDSLPDSENEHLTYGTDADDDHSLPFKGTFHGVPGEYTCTAGTCEAEADKDGNLESLSGDWTFTPAERDADKDGPHVVMGVTDMTDYLQFGYWMESTAEEDGSTSYRFKAFSGGGMPFGGVVAADTNNPAIAAVLGTATYAGPAGGLYVHKTGTLDEVESAMSGSFTANANLKAYFGEHTDVPPGSQFSIHGTVDGFRDGSRSLEGWSVKLNSASFFEAPNHSNEFDGTTTGSATSSAGTWSGQFFGVPGTAAGEDAATTHPSGVAGEFNGHFSNGHVNGAFGAELQD